MQEIRGKVADRRKPKWKPKSKGSGKQGDPKCKRCGKIKHKDPEKCPARNSACNMYKMVGHWEKKCHSKSVREVTETISQTPYFLAAVTNANRNEDRWIMQFSIGTIPVTFKIDTGADANIMADETFNKLVLGM